MSPGVLVARVQGDRLPGILQGFLGPSEEEIGLGDLDHGLGIAGRQLDGLFEVPDGLLVESDAAQERAGVPADEIFLRLELQGLLEELVSPRIVALVEVVPAEAEVRLGERGIELGGPVEIFVHLFEDGGVVALRGEVIKVLVGVARAPIGQRVAGVDLDRPKVLADGLTDIGIVVMTFDEGHPVEKEGVGLDVVRSPPPELVQLLFADRGAERSRRVLRDLLLEDAVVRGFLVVGHGLEERVLLGVDDVDLGRRPGRSGRRP